MEEDIFTKIYEQYYKLVFRYLYGLSFNRQKAEDLTQDVFVKAICVLDIPDDRIKAWLLTVAHNLHVDYIKRNRKQVYIDDNIQTKQTAKDFHKELEERDSLSRVLSQLWLLPETQRQAIILCVLNELEYEDAADIMEISVSAVTNLVYRARKTLRALRRQEDE